MQINIENIPFSSYGAFLAVSKDLSQQGNGIWIRSLIRPEWGTWRKKPSDHLLRLIPTDSSSCFIANETQCLPWELRFLSEKSAIRCVFTDDDSIVFLCERAGIVFEHDHDELKAVNITALDNELSFFYPIINYNVTINALNGAITYDAPLKRIFVKPSGAEPLFINVSACNTLLADDIRCTALSTVDEFERQSDNTKISYETFAKGFGGSGSDMTELSAYVLWSTVYHSRGNIKHDCNAVSKKLMNLVWSWDNCFNALAVYKSSSQLAWSNIYSFFKAMRPDGRLADAVNPVYIVDWFTKPPVHGYVIEKLLRAESYPQDKMRLLYNDLVRWTDWWLNNTMYNGLCHYLHPYDSGWDNATCFDSGYPIATPDLNAYLVIQLELLAKMADMLSIEGNGMKWRGIAARLLDNVVNRLWQDGRFICIKKTGEAVSTDSLIRMVPIMLGKRLPESIYTCLIDELKAENHFLTGFGLATESLRSKYYDHRRNEELTKPNAYWRGPVWAPPVYFIYCGLMDLGETEFADSIADKYCRLIERTPNAIYEDYDSLSGQGFDDSAYTWTASVYVLLKNKRGL